MQTPWESKIAAFMTDLLATQEDTLNVLIRKRELLIAGDFEGLASLDVEEEQLVERLKGCLRRRGDLLKQAAAEGLPSKDLQSLSKTLPKHDLGGQCREQIRLARARSRLLRHQGLANWVMVQKTLIHLSQMLEIIATGGRMRPTYNNKRHESVGSEACVGVESGVLVDQQV